ncbi:metabotropic glutamate receptor 4-like [Macrosteles quadrilineatus]|uniref:metabotropic glutamate receptor 4-like n=1 Tax=Macrosteles quadrilineatus TaxID=74068 RepID=UPI0023E0BEBB|nr:metabotropic glutamate receptor 4-like [Macrosteles quadrilineatus]
MTLTLLLFLTSGCPVAVLARYTYLNTSGDIMLGGLFPVHGNGRGVTECGGIQVEEGLQMLEAMLFIVNEINENEELLPGVKLGVIAYDTCDSPAYALEQSLDFIKGFIAHFNANEYHTDHPKEFVCEDNTAPMYRGGNFDKVVALLGEQSSAVTMQIATMLRLFKTPIVSYMATSPALSNPDRFPTFFRTVPSDVNQANAMLELIRRFNWTYVSIVYSDSEYGNQGYETLQQLAPTYGVCFSTPLRVSKEHFSDLDYDRIVERLANNSHAKVVVVFAEKPTVVLRLVESTRRMKVDNRFVWVGSHGWTVTDHRDHHLPVSSTLEDSLGTVNRPNHRNRQLTKDDLESHEVLEGALAIQPLASHLEGFDEYLAGLTVENHEKVNPWFKEYLEAFFHCSFYNQSDPNVSESSQDCSTVDLTITEDKGFQQHSCLHFVRDAVYAVATALHNMHRDKCGGLPGLCANMSHIENSQVVEYIRNVTFKDEKGNPFRFLKGRDGPPRYSILNFQRTDVNAFQWQIVGNYTLDEYGSPKLFLDSKRIRFSRELKDFPSSRCTQTCDDLQIRIREYDDTCCWSCINCSPYERKIDDFHCQGCDRGFLPSRNKSVCVEIPEDFINYTNPWATPALIVATE